LEVPVVRPVLVADKDPAEWVDLGAAEWDPGEAEWEAAAGIDAGDGDNAGLSAGPIRSAFGARAVTVARLSSRD
jgi:hypothetical protein